MSKSGWTALIIIGIIVLLVVLAGIFLLGNFGFSGWRGMGPGMMGNWGFGLFGVIMMLFMWLIPVGLLVLTVLGVILLVRALGNGRGPAPSARTCPNCGRNVQNDWRNCPHCGQELS